MKQFLTILTISLVLGCGKASKHEAMSIAQVPAKFMEVAKEKLPDVTFDQAVKKSSGVIEVRGKDKQGKVRDIEFSPAGEVVEIE